MREVYYTPEEKQIISTIGPKDHLLKVGDILHIKEDVQLVEEKYDGEVYTAYKIVWDYVYRR